MNASPQAAPVLGRWKRLRVLRLVLWAVFVICAAALTGALLAAEHLPEIRSVFKFLLGVSAWLMIALMLAAPISVVLHAVALFKQRPAARAAYMGMISAVLVAFGVLVALAIAGARLG